MAFLAGFVSGSLASVVLFWIAFFVVAVLEFELTKGSDGKPLFIRKSKSRRKVVPERKPKSKEQHAIQVQPKPKKTTAPIVPTVEEVPVNPVTQIRSPVEDSEKVDPALEKRAFEEAEEDSRRERSDSEGSLDSAKDEAGGGHEQGESTTGAIEVESDLLFSSKIPEEQEEAMRFFAVYNQDSYFATAYGDYVRFASLDSMGLIVPLQTSHLASVNSDSSDHIRSFTFSSDGIYLLSAHVPSNTLALHRVFHQLSKQPTLVAKLSTNFKSAKQLQHIAVKTISQNYATVAAAVGKELNLWELNLKTGAADGMTAVSLESPIKKLFLYGKNDGFRTVHPGVKAQGERLYVACLMENQEVVLKDVTLKKESKGNSVFEVSDIVTLSHFNGEAIEIVDLAIKTETFKTSKYMLCGCANKKLYLFKKGAEKLAKTKNSKGSTVLRDMAKEVLAFTVDSTEEITAVAIAPRSHMFVVACGKELLFLAYNTRNKTARIMEKIEAAHASRIVDIQVSPEESFVATREMLANKMKVWSLQKVADYERFESVNDSVQ